MMTSRQRVLTSLNFGVPDRIPKDLAGMRSTGISAFAYPKLVAALGLPPRLPRVYDPYQMLALPEVDVLDALGCDVITVCEGVSNAFPEPRKWRPYDFNGRLPALVRHPGSFHTQADATIVSEQRSMPPSSFVFDDPHGGQPIDFSADLPREDLKQYRRKLRREELRDEDIVTLRDLCRRSRQATGRAIFLSEPSIQADICIHSHGGMAIFPLLCVTDPDYVNELHTIATEHTLKNMRALLPEIRDDVDVIMMAADDWGTQNATIASPSVFRALFLPYRRRLNDELHRLAPAVQSFLHSCGAVYNIIDDIIAARFDILNPVQWPAGGHSYREWKDKSRKRIALWGGGVNAQATLPLGTIEDVEREVCEVVPYMSQDGGYVFCNIHNLVAEIPPDKVITLYQAAERAAG